MKKFLLMSLMLISFGFVFNSCSDDDDDSIVGTWKYTPGNISAEVDATPSEFAQALKKYIVGDDIPEQKMVIADDKIEYFYNGNSISKGVERYTYKNGILTTYDEYDDEPYSYQVNISKNQLILKEDWTDDFKSLSSINDVFEEFENDLKGVNPEDVKVSKAIFVIKYTRE